MLVTPVPMVIVPLKPEQFLKTDVPMVFTESGMTRFPVSPAHPENAHAPIPLTLFPMVSVPLKPLQPRKALFPMFFTEFGMTRLPVRFEQK